MKGKKVLITGASGQIGRGLVHVLHRDSEVHALARFRKPEVLEEVVKKAERVWQIDMGVERPTALPTDFDVVFHMAVDWGGNETWADQKRAFHISCDFVADLMAMNERAVFVLGSTGSVYKKIEGLCREDETPLYGGETYVTAKIAMSQLARWISVATGRKVAELRYYYPYAPYLEHNRLGRLLSGGIFGKNPRATHQRTYIKHHVDKTILAASFAASPPEVFNCATNENLTLGELARIGARLTGSPLSDDAQSDGMPPGPGETADTTKMVQLLGPTPISAEEGFRRYLSARQLGINWPEDWMFEP
jgi:nucleoside-diphosphate-sugar epimerase